MPKRWVFGLATAAVAVIALWLVTLKPAHDAKMFLREFTELNPQAVSIEEITSLYNRYGGKLIEDTQTPTTILEVKFENRVLAGLRIAPPTALIVSTVISSGKIDYSHAALRIQTSKISPGVSVTEFLHVEDQPPISIQAIRRPEGPPREAYIKITDRLLPATRRKVFAFNTNCLSSWRACQAINDFLPTFPELERSQTGGWSPLSPKSKTPCKCRAFVLNGCPQQELISLPRNSPTQAKRGLEWATQRL